MEKENNKLMLKFSRIFTSSCKNQDISKVIDHKNPMFTPLTPLMESDSKHSPPLICKPRCPVSFDLMVLENCILATTTPSPRRKITGKYSLLTPAGDFSGSRCPPTSPVSPLLTQKMPVKKQEKKEKKTTHLANNHPFNFSSSNETEFFSSDDEREEEDGEITKTESTLFSSSLKSVSFSSKAVSLSSDSDPPNPGRVRTQRRRRRRERLSEKDYDITKTENPLFSSLKSVSFSAKSISLSSDSDPDPTNPVRARNNRRRRAGPAMVVKDSFAVVKNSSDPYSDFTTSMVEMIMEKQIFGSIELENLLECFLSLNSPHHHRVILEVFTEICDALFSNWS